MVLSSVVFGGDQPVVIVDDVKDNESSTQFLSYRFPASNDDDRALLRQNRARELAFASTDLLGVRHLSRHSRPRALLGRQRGTGLKA